MSKAIVSVVVPTKNSAATLSECLKSIQEQTYPEIELIVVDNFSTDGTQEIARQFTKHLFIQGPERSSQRNYGADKAHGQYLCMVDSDMELTPTVIEECVKAMENGSEIAGVVIPEESFGVGFWAQCKRLERSFYLGVPFMEAARFFRRSDYIKLGGYDEKLVASEDWDLSQRIGEIGKIVRIKSFIFHNEGHISLRKTIKKKFYYAQKFSMYMDGHNHHANVPKQVGILSRYGLFFAHPIKLFRNPVLGIGMLFMKTCEFCFGAIGYLMAKMRSYV